MIMLVYPVGPTAPQDRPDDAEIAALVTVFPAEGGGIGGTGPVMSASLVRSFGCHKVTPEQTR
jgi:hypothetical protein